METSPFRSLPSSLGASATYPASPRGLPLPPRPRTFDPLPGPASMYLSGTASRVACDDEQARPIPWCAVVSSHHATRGRLGAPPQPCPRSAGPLHCSPRGLHRLPRCPVAPVPVPPSPACSPVEVQTRSHGACGRPSAYPIPWHRAESREGQTRAPFRRETGVQNGDPSADVAMARGRAAGNRGGLPFARDVANHKQGPAGDANCPTNRPSLEAAVEQGHRKCSTAELSSGLGKLFPRPPRHAGAAPTAPQGVIGESGRLRATRSDPVGTSHDGEVEEGTRRDRWTAGGTLLHPAEDRSIPSRFPPLGSAPAEVPENRSHGTNGREQGEAPRYAAEMPVRPWSRRSRQSCRRSVRHGAGA